jgi:murein DD-endopeptidase MepM/ murein hydrolase activator NlpD
MRWKSYTLMIASSERGTVRKIQVPYYTLYLLAAVLLTGVVTLAVAAATYSRMLWKAASYNALKQQQTELEEKYRRLQAMVRDSNQRLSSLQSLATEVAMTYGVARFHPTPFGLSRAALDAEEAYQQSVEQFDFLVRNASAVRLAAHNMRLIPGLGFSEATFVPSLWPVLGHISGGFGERLDPFTGEGEFHTGIDIAAEYGTPVRATADGYVAVAEVRAGYGRLVVIEHGFGLTTWYGHLSSITAHAGTRVRRGEVIGYVGVSGRTTAPHVHYEVRSFGAPINPWRYLRTSTAD